MLASRSAILRRESRIAVVINPRIGFISVANVDWACCVALRVRLHVGGRFTAPAILGGPLLAPVINLAMMLRVVQAQSTHPPVPSKPLPASARNHIIDDVMVTLAPRNTQLNRSGW